MPPIQTNAQDEYRHTLNTSTQTVFIYQTPISFPTPPHHRATTGSRVSLLHRFFFCFTSILYFLFHKLEHKKPSLLSGIKITVISALVVSRTFLSVSAW